MESLYHKVNEIMQAGFGSLNRLTEIFFQLFIWRTRFKLCWPTNIDVFKNMSPCMNIYMSFLNVCT
jgi:hypothetical protein